MTIVTDRSMCRPSGASLPNPSGLKRAANLRGGFLLHLRARRTRSVRRLVRNLAWSPRPAPADCFLERPAEHENDEHQHNPDHDDLPLRNRASRAPLSRNLPKNGFCPKKGAAFLTEDSVSALAPARRAAAASEPKAPLCPLTVRAHHGAQPCWRKPTC